MSVEDAQLCVSTQITNKQLNSKYMNNRFVILWLTWTFVGIALVYGIAASDSKSTMISIIANVLSLSPLIGLLFALGSVKASRQFNDWLRSDQNSVYYVAGGISILFMLPGLLTLKFDPYFSVIFAAIVFAVLGVLKQIKNQEFTLTWSDLLLWIVLWIPFDLRWYMGILPHGIDSYAWFSVAISVIGIIGWNGYRGANIGYNLVPKLKDLRIVLLSMLIISVLVVPPGLLTGFLTFSIPKSYNIPELILEFIGLFLTVALPEELFFRGILLGGLDKLFSKKWVPLVISSLAFGLMHWNNVNTLSTQLTYVSLAAVAGMGYGWAYRKSGNNLLAAILVHTIVDWAWRLFLTT
jgi:membrane protease YdiL (CAAX protease family)